jgi:hypothetical protein
MAGSCSTGTSTIPTRRRSARWHPTHTTRRRRISMSARASSASCADARSTPAPSTGRATSEAQAWTAAAADTSVAYTSTRGLWGTRCARAHGGGGTHPRAAEDGAANRGACLVRYSAIQPWRADAPFDTEAHRRRSAGSGHPRQAWEESPQPSEPTPFTRAASHPRAAAHRAAWRQRRTQSRRRRRCESAPRRCGASLAMHHPSATSAEWRCALVWRMAPSRPPPLRTPPRRAQLAST